MDKVKLAIIFNPAARGEKARSLEEKVRSLTGPDTPLITSRPGETAELARQLAQEGHSTIVAAGGDGTINEVVNGIAGLDVSLGILPIGTMNILACELGLPTTQLEQCWEIIQGGFIRSIDLALANDQYFVQLAGIGLDALAVRETDLNMRRTIGPISYIFAAAQIIGRPAPRLEICFNERETMGGCFVLVGNGRFYGGPLSFFPNAKNDDGLLDVLVFKHQGYLDIIRYLQGVLIGNHADFADIEYRQIHSLSVISDRRVPVEIDGEVSFHTPVHFRVGPSKLRVHVG
ncbi:MAG: diacylglycerol kinase family protein [Chthoniobacterales bacterium]|jgi:diacylglycerol kinase (ATP)